jgi:ABC-type glycerol-3-phosphate transport system permease component
MKNVLRNTSIGIGVLIVLAFFLTPYLWMFVSSLKDYDELWAVPPSIIPRNPTFDYYRALLTGEFGLARQMGFIEWSVVFPNTVFVGMIVAIIVTVFTLLGGYALGRLDIPGKDSIILLILLSILLPGASIMLPVYFMERAIGLIDSLWGLILFYPILSLPFTLWMSISFFRSIPKELEDAALVDGASRLGALSRIILPLSKIFIVTTFIVAFLMSWNHLSMALILIHSPKQYVVPIGMVSFAQYGTVYWNEMGASMILLTFPLVIAFLLIQRYFIRGLMSGFIKG